MLMPMLSIGQRGRDHCLGSGLGFRSSHQGSQGLRTGRGKGSPGSQVTGRLHIYPGKISVSGKKPMALLRTSRSVSLSGTLRMDCLQKIGREKPCPKGSAVVVLRCYNLKQQETQRDLRFPSASLNLWQASCLRLGPLLPLASKFAALTSSSVLCRYKPSPILFSTQERPVTPQKCEHQGDGAPVSHSVGSGTLTSR